MPTSQGRPRGKNSREIENGRGNNRIKELKQKTFK
jgi:hypothetical protein